MIKVSMVIISSAPQVRALGTMVLYTKPNSKLRGVSWLSSRTRASGLRSRAWIPMSVAVAALGGHRRPLNSPRGQEEAIFPMNSRGKKIYNHSFPNILLDMCMMGSPAAPQRWRPPSKKGLGRADYPPAITRKDFDHLSCRRSPTRGWLNLHQIPVSFFSKVPIWDDNHFWTLYFCWLKPPISQGLVGLVQIFSRLAVCHSWRESERGEKRYLILIGG